MSIQFKRKKIEKFIEESKLIHGEKYTYDRFEYLSAHTKSIITCKIHGDFEQSPNSHVSKKNGCRKCGRDKVSDLQRLGVDRFIEISNYKHKYKFNYSNVKYISNNIKVEIICDKGHLFKQTPDDHMRGGGCAKCKGFYKSTSDIINLFISTHKDKYVYDKVDYIDSKTKVIITCKEHGDFSQNPYDHSIGRGCMKCNTLGKVSEPKLLNKIRELFNNCKVVSNARIEWLGRQSLDIFLEDYNIAIEYQGIQHFKSDKFFGGEKGFLSNLSRDKKKRKLCIENNIKLFYFTYNKSHIPEKYFDKVYHNEEELLSEIRNIIKKSSN